MLNSYAQEVSNSLVERFKDIQNYKPTDKLFLHTDKNLYRPGDTIYFQTYVEDRFTQEFETSSLSSWVMLLNSAGKTIDSARFRVDKALAPGWLAIPDDCVPGWYRLNAFTSQMQNYSPEFAFSSWIRIDELLKENLVFNYRFNQKSYRSKDTVELSIEFKNQDGKALKNTSFSYSIIEKNKTKSTYRTKTTRKGISLLRVFLPDSLENKNMGLDIVLEKGLGEFQVDIPVIEQNPDIHFLPESGTFIPGYRQKVAFNGVKSSGKQLFLKGVLRDDLGNFIDSLKSGTFGPGIFEFTPQAGRKYYAGFTDYPGKKWFLPKLEELVPCMRINQEKKEIIIDLSGGNTKEQYFLALSKNYKVVAFAPFTIDKSKRVVFKCDSLPPGMVKVTLLKESLQPIAERTLFIPQKDAPHFIISTESNFYKPEQQTTLGVEIQGIDKNYSGVFSIGVIDSSTALSPQINFLSIKDYFLFEEGFYKRLPFHIKQKGLSNLPAEELDLLFLTYGWSKFNSEIHADQKKEKLLNYDLFKIEITQVYSSRKRKKIDHAKNPLFILSVDDPALIGLDKNLDSSYLLDIDSVPSFTSKVMIVPNFILKNKINAVSLKPVINKDYFEYFKNRRENKEIFHQIAYGLNTDPVFNLDSFRVLKEIDVYAKREPAKNFANEYEKRYQGVTTKTVKGVRVESATTLEDILHRLGAGSVNTYTKTMSLRGGLGTPIKPNNNFEKGALFVLDGIPVEKSYRSLVNVLPSNIHSVTALMGVSGFYIYGEDALGGVIFIETKLNHIGDEYELSEKPNYDKGDLGKVIELFRSSKEFYNPPKTEIQNDPELWIRPTLYWNHEVFYDGKNPVKIQYYNHRKKGTIFIVLNGVTEDGEPVSEIHKYQIK